MARTFYPNFSKVSCRWKSVTMDEVALYGKGNSWKAVYKQGQQVLPWREICTIHSRCHHRINFFSFFATQHLFHPFKSAPWIPLEELLLLQHGLLHEIVNYMSCPPSEVKNQLRSLFMNFESCTKWQRMKKRLTFTRSRLEDGVIPVALVPACLLQLPIHSFNSHSFIQYPSN